MQNLKISMTSKPVVQKGSKLFPCVKRTSDKDFQGHRPLEASVPLGVLGQVKGRAGAHVL